VVWIANALVIPPREASTPAVRGPAANWDGGIQSREHHPPFFAASSDPSGRECTAARNTSLMI
jgi:hypothetical protein